MYVCRKNLVVIERICIFVVGIAATILLFYFTIIYIGLIFSLGLSAVENTPLNFFLDNEKKGYIFAIVSKKKGKEMNVMIETSGQIISLPYNLFRSMSIDVSDEVGKERYDLRFEYLNGYISILSYENEDTLRRVYELICKVMNKTATDGKEFVLIDARRMEKGSLH